MTKTIRVTYIVANNHRNELIRALAIACVILGGIYVYNIYRIISRSVALEQVRKETAAVSRNVDALDSEYMKLSGVITPDGLAAYGLQEGEVTAYISRTASLGKIVRAGNEL